MASPKGRWQALGLALVAVICLFLAGPVLARPNPFEPYNTLEELRDAVRSGKHNLHQRQASDTATRSGTLVTVTAAPTTTKKTTTTSARPAITPPPGVSPLPGTSLTRRDQGVYHRFDFRNANVHRFYLDLEDKNYPCMENEMQIADQGCSGDEFNVYLDGILLGRTTVAEGGRCTFTNIVPGAFLNDNVDMTATPDREIFPGIAWDVAWSSGRFVLPNDFHVLEIELYKRGDGTWGAFNFYETAWGCRQQDITGKVTEEWHSQVILDQEIYVWPNVPGIVFDINVPAGRCMNLTIWDTICPGDQWNVYVNNRSAGTSTEPTVSCCRFWLQNEGSREYPNFKMGWDWWDIIMPEYGEGRFSQHTVWLPEGQNQVRFQELGGGDGRTAYMYARLEDCPAGYENGRFREVAFTKTPLATTVTSVWPQQTECAVGTGEQGTISVATVPTRTYETWGVTPTSEPRLGRRDAEIVEVGSQGWFSWLW